MKKEKSYYRNARISAIVMCVVGVVCAVSAGISGDFGLCLLLLSFAGMGALYYVDMKRAEIVRDWAVTTDESWEVMRDLARKAIDLNDEINRDSMLLYEKYSRQTDALLDLLHQMTDEQYDRLSDETKKYFGDTGVQ